MLNGTAFRATNMPNGRHYGDNEYKHILIPTRFAPRERFALRLASQLAMANNAKITLLHVLPPAPTPSVHWLDAIDKLHQSLSHTTEPVHVGVEAIEAARAEMQAFVERNTPHYQHDVAPIAIECRVGDPAEEIARFAEEQHVDLILACSNASAWKVRFWPGVLQRLMRLTHRQVVIVRSDKAPSSTHATPLSLQLQPAE